MNIAPQSTAGLWILLVLVFSAGAGSYFWMTAPVDEKRALMRYVRPVTNSANPHQLQRWAVDLMREKNSELSSTNAQTPLISEVPPLVRTIPTLGFLPAQITLCRVGHESEREPHVGIVYLGGFGSWCLRVGAETFRLEEDRHCYEWIPGVYITINP